MAFSKAARRFVKPETVDVQLALPVSRAARVHNRQVAEKVSGEKVRRGLGRPAKAVKSATAVTHTPRPEIRDKEVLHLTLKLRPGMPNLRRDKTFKAIQKSFYLFSSGDGFRLTEFSVQRDHLHFIAEADSKLALSRAMHKLAISLSRRLNGLWQRLTGVWTGKIFKERYHEHALRSPLEVRRALLYVLQKGKKHGWVKPNERDFYSSAHYFGGFANVSAKPMPGRLVARATAWQLTRGWRKYGLIKLEEMPASSITASLH